MNPAEFSPAANYVEKEADDAPQDRPSLNVSPIFHGETEHHNGRVST